MQQNAASRGLRQRPEISRARGFLRRTGALAATIAVLAGGLVAWQAGSPADAAPGPNPSVALNVTKQYDGTGHGTPSASFVNTANGFSPGDDTPSDGIVSSFDAVGYEVALSFQAGLQRTVAVKLNLTDGLRLRSSLTEFCAPLAGITAQLSGETCLFTVPQGAAANFARTVVLEAEDTEGSDLAGQRLSASVGLQSAEPYATVAGAAVTVVSVPAVDLVLGADDNPSANRVYPHDGSAEGAFLIETRPVTRAGFSPAKGASVAGEWTARVNVASFPVDTVWTFEGRPVVRSGDWLSLGPATGGGELAFRLPGGWPSQHDGTTERYVVWLDVPDTAFASGDRKNNGSGWQPGTGQGRTSTTYDAALGTVAGMPFPNNDYGVANVFKPLPVDGQLVGKSVVYPLDLSQTKFEPGNLRWEQARQVGWSSIGDPAPLAAGAEFANLLWLFSTEIEDTGRIIVADEWDTALQQANGPVTVVRRDDPMENPMAGGGVPVDPSQYRVFWSTQATGSDLVDPDQTSGWVEQAEPPANARAVRVIFEEGAIPTGSETGAGDFRITVPSRIPSGLAPAAGPVVADTAWFRIGGAFGSVSGAVRLAFPATPTLRLEHTTAQPHTERGAEIAYTVAPSIVNPTAVANGFDPTVTVELDRCVTAPANTSRDWQMTIAPAVPGASSGKVCGDPTSTPIRLTFTPTTTPMQAADWDQGAAIAQLHAIGYTVRSLRTAPLSVVSSAEFSVAGAGDRVIPVSDDAISAVGAIASSFAQVTSNPQKEEVGEPLHWQIDLSAKGDVGSETATVIVLPRDGDEAAHWGAISNPDLYPGEHGSRFHGGYALSGLTLDPEESSDGIVLLYTVDASPAIDTAEAHVWHPVTLAGQGGRPPLADATAVRVLLPEQVQGAVALIDLTLDPTGNRKGDVYVLWAAQMVDSAGGEIAPVPWPAQVEVVSSAISGTVWFDSDSSATREGGEPRIEGVEIGLFRVVDGQPQQNPLRTATTDGDGFYEFADLKAGEYVTRIIDRGPDLRGSSVSYYGQSLSVDPTYSYRNRTHALAGVESTVVTLPRDRTQLDVDFGFFDASPRVDVDKHEGIVSCDDAASLCDVAWQIDIENLGNADIAGGTLTDTMTAGVYDVEMMLGEFDDVVAQLVPRTTGGGFALTAKGRVYSWGSGEQGANGNGSNADAWSAAPVEGIPADAVVREVVDRSGWGGYALTATGEVYSWGAGWNGGNGDGSDSANPIAAKVALPGSVRVTKVIARGDQGAYAITDAGQVYSWGFGQRGVNGDGSGDDNLTPQPIDFPAAPTIVDVVVRAGALTSHGVGAYAVSDDGRVFAWGSRNMYANGNGESGFSVDFTPVQVNLPGGARAEHVIAKPSGYGGFAITTTGELYAWGQGSSGLNGNGSEADAQFPVAVPLPAGSVVRQVVTGLFQEEPNAAFLLTTAGEVFSWGESPRGYGGRGNTVQSLSPVKLTSLPQISKLELRAGRGGVYALASDGRVFAWGVGESGALGNDATADQHAPVEVQGLPGGIIDVIDRGSGGYALTADGRVFSWGSGAAGTNGNGSTDDRLRAAAVPGVSDVRQLRARAGWGSESGNPPYSWNGVGAYALKSDGTVAAWGPNTRGSGGYGPGATSTAPALVTGLPAGFELGESAILPTSSEPVGGDTLTKRSYTIPSISAGETLSVIVRGKIVQSASGLTLLNQAWFTSPTTPYGGIPKNRGLRTEPILPNDPGSAFNPAGITGNASCDTSVDGQNRTTPDSCDQVPLRIPAAASTPGSLRGYVWVDANADGVLDASEPRVGGVLVGLYGPSGVLMGQTRTGSNGIYEFRSVPAGEGYYVHFGVRGVEPSQAAVDAALGAGHSPHDLSYGFTGRAPECVSSRSCADPSTSLSSPGVAVQAGQVTRHVNAGLVLSDAKLAVVKTSQAGDPAELPVDPQTGESAPTPVDITITNTGREALTRFTWSDQTLEGPAVENIVCRYQGVVIADPQAFVLPTSWPATVPDQSNTVACTGTLPAMAVDGSHRDRFTVEASGVDTFTPVGGSDDWVAAVDPKPSWSLAKTAGPASGERVGLNQLITYTLTATNTGDLPLSDLVVTDDMSGVLSHAAIEGALPPGVTRSGSTLTWNVPTLERGQTLNVFYTVRVNRDAYAVELVNSAWGDGSVAPASCTAADPCVVRHPTPDPPSIINLPVLGGWTVPAYLGIGAVVLAAAWLVKRKNRRRVAAEVPGPLAGLEERKE